VFEKLEFMPVITILTCNNVTGARSCFDDVVGAGYFACGYRMSDGDISNIIYGGG
jgi:hypothetical protein